MNYPEIIAIACLNKYGVIGYKSMTSYDFQFKMLYHFKKDLELFKKYTTKNIVLMGMNTWLSIGSKPLPNRINIVISKDRGYLLYGIKSESLYHFTTVAEAIQFISNKFSNKKKLYIIGGGDIYKECLPFCNSLLIDYVDDCTTVGNIYIYKKNNEPIVFPIIKRKLFIRDNEPILEFNDIDTYSNQEYTLRLYRFHNYHAKTNLIEYLTKHETVTK